MNSVQRPGLVEADAGGTTTPDLSNKMANTLHASNRLRRVYNPVNLVSVRRVDEARKTARTIGSVEGKESRNRTSGRYVCSPLGSRTVNTDPFPGSLVTVTSPPIMRASLRERARPSPVPP
jgi:hypothetical protein